MHIDPTWPEGVVRQSHDCIFVQAPTPEQGRRDRGATDRADGRMEDGTGRHE